MHLVTAISILTGPNTLTVLLECINLFNLNQNSNINTWKELPILGLTLLYI